MDEHEWTYLPGNLAEMYFAERKKERVACRLTYKLLMPFWTGKKFGI